MTDESRELETLASEYRRKYGADLDAAFGKVFSQITAERNADDLFMLHLHILQVVQIIGEAIQKAEIIPHTGSVSWN